MNASNCRVSAIIPAYNSEKTVEKCVKSVLSQKPYEVIVVDDGSADKTASIVKRLDKVRLLRHEKNFGLAVARNTGVLAAKGDIILFIDSDCEADKNLVKKIIETYDKGVDGVGGIGVEVGTSMPDRWRQLTGGQGYGDRKRVGVPFLFGLCSSYRRSVLLEAGLFDKEFRTNGEDVDMGLRLNGAGKNLVYEPAAKVVHHRHDTLWSLVKMVYRAYKFGYLAYLKNRGIMCAFKILLVGAPINFLRGLDIVAKKSSAKNAHLVFVILAFFAEVIGFAAAAKLSIRFWKK